MTARPRWLSAVLLVLVVVAGVVASPEADELDRNRKLLDRWKADPDHHARLTADQKAFHALPPARQAQLRQLDRRLHDLDSRSQAKLWGVLERYAAWLEALPAEDRARIQALDDPAERLTLVRALRERDWVERLPARLRDELAQLPAARRQARIDELRREDRQLRILWQLPPRPKSDPTTPAPPSARPARLEQLTPDVQKFVREHLLPCLSPAESAELHQAEGKWPAYVRTLADLAERNPVLPPLPPPHKAVLKYDDLPADCQALLPRAHLQRRKLWDGLAQVEGRWPDFARAFTELARRERHLVVPPLGASRPGELPAEAGAFVLKRLVPALNEVEARNLAKLEGRWPDYPLRLHDLAQRYHLPIPGLSLPGPRELWDGARMAGGGDADDRAGHPAPPGARLQVGRGDGPAPPAPEASVSR